MKIFISHSTQNREIALRFSTFLENISSDIEVFCSNEDESIITGENFIKTIFYELNTSDLFIPMISNEYYNSRFCMIELGVAFSYYLNKYNNQNGSYIFPFILDTTSKEQALSGTPMTNMQVGSLRDEKDIHGFLAYLHNKKDINIGSGINRKLHTFIADIEQIIGKHQDIIKSAKICAYFDDRVEFKHREDIVNISNEQNAIVVNYNINPYEKRNFKYPKFISVAFRYIDNLNILRYLQIDSQAKLTFELINFTDSLKRICVEFKYSDYSKILDTFEFTVNYGENKINIPLEKIKSKALSNISEICFVIHPDDIKEKNGMFKIGGVGIV